MSSLLHQRLLHYCWGLLLPASFIQAQSLQSILADALVNDPLLLEARANEIGAHNVMKATQAKHYPVISAVGNQILARQSDNGTETDKRFNPGLKGTLNLFSWGGIHSAVQRDREKERYFYYKYGETREELGNTIGQQYLTALRAKESLQAMQQNLERHNKIIRDLEIIVRYDPGRRSELTQAKSRRLQVESNMAQARRTMDLALSRLARYSRNPLRRIDLQVPFTESSPDTLVSRFRSPDLTAVPSYQAQAAELESARASLEVSKAARLPALNLEGQVTRNTKEVYLSLSWNIFDRAAAYSVAQSAQSQIAAQSRLEQMLREVAEKSRTAEVDMRQSHNRANITQAQIAAQQQVVKSYELQFKIARRNLIDVLDSYNELTNVELAHVAANNDYRDAALAYLRAQAQIANWANVATPQPTRLAADARENTAALNQANQPSASPANADAGTDNHPAAATHLAKQENEPAPADTTHTAQLSAKEIIQAATAPVTAPATAQPSKPVAAAPVQTAVASPRTQAAMPPRTSPAPKPLASDQVPARSAAPAAPITPVSSYTMYARTPQAMAASAVQAAAPQRVSSAPKPLANNQIPARSAAPATPITSASSPRTAAVPQAAAASAVQAAAPKRVSPAPKPAPSNPAPAKPAAPVSSYMYEYTLQPPIVMPPYEYAPSKPASAGSGTTTAAASSPGANAHPPSSKKR